MGHHIQAMIAASSVAGAICLRFPELVRVATPLGFAILPVDADFVDSHAAMRPPSTGDGFRLLTPGFRELLQDLSRCGAIAYVETDYFGGKGGQGAVVHANGNEVMIPTWSTRGPINRALKIIGVPKPILADRFSGIGLPLYRSNDALALSQ